MRKSQQGLQASLARLFLRLCPLYQIHAPLPVRLSGVATVLRQPALRLEWLHGVVSASFIPTLLLLGGVSGLRSGRTARFPVEKPASLDYGRR